MRRKTFKNIKLRIEKTGIELDQLESLSRVLTDCIIYSAPRGDVENISYILTDNVLRIKKEFRKIREILKI